MTLQEYVSEQFVGKNRDLNLIQEDIFKTIKEGWQEKLGYVPMKPMALITVHNPNSKIIESIGFSDPNDLLLNNFGKAFAGMINSGTDSRILTNESNTVFTVNMNDNAGNSYARNDKGTGMRMKVGRGGAIARTDFVLSDAFVVAPQSGFIVITPGGWLTASQTVVINGLLSSVVGSDTIGECALFARWRTAAGGVPSHDFMISHDVAGASFTDGQNINVTYTWSIT